MKNVPLNIEKYISEGYVLDVRGKWVSIADKVALERKFLSHLEAGEVLLNRTWVSIENARNSETVSFVTEGSGSGNNFSSVKDTEQNFSSSFYDKNADKVIPELHNNSIHDYGNVSEELNAFSDAEIDEETRTIDIRKQMTDNMQNTSIDSSENDDYLEETMSFDMRAILNSNMSREPVGKLASFNDKSVKREALGGIVDKWEFEQKKKLVLIFSISATVAIFAIAGAVVLGFVL